MRRGAAVEPTSAKRRAGIALLILGLLHVPLPLPDYHSLSHHDRPDGEVCERHNHLLKWHGGVARGSDRESERAVFHWHWVWPGRQPAEHDADDAGPPVLHADGDGWVEPTIEATPPCLSPERTVLASFSLDPPSAVAVLPPPRPFPPWKRGAPFLRAPFARFENLPSVLQRWNC